MFTTVCCRVGLHNAGLWIHPQLFYILIIVQYVVITGYLLYRADAPIIAQVWEHFIDNDLESGFGYIKHFILFLIMIEGS